MDFQFVHNLTYQGMVEPYNISIEPDWQYEQILLSITRLLEPLSNSLPFEKQYHLFLSGGVPFTGGSLNGLLNNQDLVGCRKIIYVVVTRPLNQAYLEMEYHEICNCMNQEIKCLLSPILDQSKYSLIIITCFLEYLRHGKFGCIELLQSLSQKTIFAPLIIGLYKIINGDIIEGKTLAIVVSCLVTIINSDLRRISKEQNIYIEIFALMSHLITEYEYDLHYSIVQTLPNMNIYAFKPDLDSDLFLEYESMKLRLSDYNNLRDNCRYSNCHPDVFMPIQISQVINRGSPAIVAINDVFMVFLMMDPNKYGSAYFIDPTMEKVLTMNLIEEMKVENLPKESFTQINYILVDTSGSMAKSMNGDFISDSNINIVSRAAFAKEILKEVYKNYKSLNYTRPSLFCLVGEKEEIFDPPEIRPLDESFLKQVDLLDHEGQFFVFKLLVSILDFIHFNESKKYPNSRFRVIIITDSENVNKECMQLVGSKLTPNISIDTIILGTICKESIPIYSLSQITGGVCIHPSNIPDLKVLFNTEELYDFYDRPLMHIPRKVQSDFEGYLASIDMEKVLTTLNVHDTELPWSHPNKVLSENVNQKFINSVHRYLYEQLKFITQYNSENPNIRILTSAPSFSKWAVLMRSPVDSYYGNKWWFIEFCFTEKYPQVPPICRFINCIPYHLNVFDNGIILFNGLYADYKSYLPIDILIEQIYGLFKQPNCNTVASNEKALQYCNNQKKYIEMANNSGDLNPNSTYEKCIERLVITNDIDNPKDIEQTAEDHESYSLISGTILTAEEASSYKYYTTKELNFLKILFKNDPFTGIPLTDI